MTYTVLNAVFLAVALVVLVVALRSHRPRLHRTALIVTAGVLLTLTAVFDNIMIGVGLVDYGEAQTSGARLGNMPVEDFSYTVFAVLALPALWTLLGRRGADGPSETDGRRAADRPLTSNGLSTTDGSRTS